MSGHKIIFIGAGTSGRLGILEAVECVPTFGVKPTDVQGILAGGNAAVFRSKEGAEDNALQGAKDILAKAAKNDFVIGLTASGITPYVLGALKAAKKTGCHTALLACNPKADTTYADIFIFLPTGSEALNGSTRMKAGTAQKMILNMLSTGAMVRYGRVRGNFMAYMIPSNQKLVSRAIRMICQKTGCTPEVAEAELKKANNIIADAMDAAPRFFFSNALKTSPDTTPAKYPLQAR